MPLEPGLEGAEVHKTLSEKETAYTKMWKPDGAVHVKGPGRAGCGLEPLMQTGE